MAFPWRLLLIPALLACLRAAHIDIYLPRNLLVIRILFACAQLALFASLGLIYQRISRDGDEKKSVKVKVPSLTGGPDEEKEMTHKDFDMFELRRIAFCFGGEVAVAVGIHVCMAYVPVLFIEMVSEPFTFYDQAYYLFALYILNSKDDKLKRPLPVDSPVAKFEAMKKDETNDDDVSEPTPAIEDSANTTGSQPLSRAERRPRRVGSVDVNEE